MKHLLCEIQDVSLGFLVKFCERTLEQRKAPSVQCNDLIDGHVHHTGSGFMQLVPDPNTPWCRQGI